jgi:hypothetical protein
MTAGLIRVLSLLSRHFDWGVEPVVGGAGGAFLHRYFSSVEELHDPTTGPPNFWPAGFLVGTGEAKRKEAYDSLMRRAKGWCCGPRSTNIPALVCNIVCTQYFVAVVDGEGHSTQLCPSHIVFRQRGQQWWPFFQR